MDLFCGCGGFSLGLAKERKTELVTGAPEFKPPETKSKSIG